MGLFSLLNINAQSMGSFQKGINVVNKNINNVSNKDYAKEQTVFNASSTYGVSLNEAYRMYNQRFFDRYIQENQKYHFYNEASSSLDSIEALFNDIQGSGLSEAINNYYDAINDIISTPDNIPARESFLTKSEVLISKFKNIYNTLENEKTNLHLSMHNEIAQINQLSDNLALLNKRIASQPTNLVHEQEKLNDLLNERDKIIKELSEHIDIKVRYNPNNTADIFSAKGHTLVVSDKSFHFSLKETNKDLGYGLQTTSIDVFIDNIKLTDNFNAGKLGAKIQTEKNIDDTIVSLNNLLHEFATQNNNVHKNGVDLNADAGEDIFIDATSNSTDINLSNVAINPNISNNPEKIAAALDANSLPADNENIKKLYELKDKTFANLDNKSFYNYYISIVSHISNEKSFYNDFANDTLLMRDSIDDKIQELSGVNLDEELVNLMQLQRSYEAAARVITVTDKLLETVMNMVH